MAKCYSKLVRVPIYCSKLLLYFNIYFLFFLLVVPLFYSFFFLSAHLSLSLSLSLKFLTISIFSFFTISPSPFQFCFFLPTTQSSWWVCSVLLHFNFFFFLPLTRVLTHTISPLGFGFGGWVHSPLSLSPYAGLVDVVVVLVDFGCGSCGLVVWWWRWLVLGVGLCGLVVVMVVVVDFGCGDGLCGLWSLMCLWILAGLCGYDLWERDKG